MPYLKKPEGRYDVSGIKAEMEKADAAIETADAKLKKENVSGAKDALNKAVGHFSAAIDLSHQIDFGGRAGNVLSRFYYCRGRAKVLLNKIERGSANTNEAIADLLKSAELEPEARTYLRLAEAYAQAGDLDAAIESIDQSISLDFNCVEAHILKKLYHEERGDENVKREDADDPIVF